LTKLNEAVAEGIMTQAEKNKIEGIIGNYTGNSRRIAGQLAKLEAKIKQTLKTSKGKKRIPGVSLKKWALRAKSVTLVGRTTNKFLHSGKPFGVMKKAAGNAASLAFLASDVKDAWNEAVEEWHASD
jgi:hypothetical protein